jgi:erythromycin esterase
LGYHLRRELGAAYFGLGLVFDHGEFRAGWSPTLFSRRDPHTDTFRVPSAPRGTMEGMLARAKMPLFVLDLAPRQTGDAVATWLHRASYARSIGASFNDRADRKFGWFSTWEFTVPAEAYDAVAYVEATTPSVGCVRQPLEAG